MVKVIICFMVQSLWRESRFFLLHCWSSSGSGVDWLCHCILISSTMVVGDWCILFFTVVVNGWRISILIVLTRHCPLSGPQCTGRSVPIHIKLTKSWDKQLASKLSLQTMMNNIFHDMDLIFFSFSDIWNDKLHNVLLHQSHERWAVCMVYNFLGAFLM